jgi:four helix bundle protein
MTPPELRERSQRFALDVGRFCETLSPDPRTQEIANQLHDAAHSTASNYRAVCRARTPKEFISKLCVVVEESDEVQGWLDALVSSGRGGAVAKRLLQEATELVAIFTASKHTWLRNEAARLERAKQDRLTAKRRRR